MELLEYKMDANDVGNLIVPNFISRNDSQHFYNPTNHTFVGIRLSQMVKVPDAVSKLTRSQLITRCKIAGVMMKNVGTITEPQMEQMTDLEIEAIVNTFCDVRSIV